LPPSAPREATEPDALPSGAPKAPADQEPNKPKTEPAPTEVENALPAPLDGAREASVGASPELKPEAPKTEPQLEARTRPSVTAQSPGLAQGPGAKPAAPDSSAESNEKSKVSIVPAAAFE
jgi:hypothetical protein